MIRVEDGVGNFGKWLISNIFSIGFDVTNFCYEYDISRKTIYNHIYKKHIPTIKFVRRYCKIFGKEDQVWDIYDMLLSDWGLS